MSEARIITIAAIAYAVMAVMTYGHAYHNSPCDHIDRDSMRVECAAVGGILASSVWPLYWSAQAWRDSE